MRSVHGRSALAGAFFLLGACGATAAPQVVGDEACEKHAVDIAAFATCEGGRVVRPAEAPPPAASAVRVAPSPARAAAPAADPDRAPRPDRRSLVQRGGQSR
jgi:hypothetical protein